MVHVKKNFGIISPHALSVCVCCPSVVQVQFSAASYSALESDPALLTMVETNATLATPLFLSVTPLSYAEARGRGLSLPPVRPPPANSECSRNRLLHNITIILIACTCV